MVRETRHLWVGNLPENIREDRIREHFKRYGRVQSVKLLPRVSEEKTGEVAVACTVAFMDIKSASKAHNAELKIDDRTLNTEYYEPAAIPSAASPQGTPPPYSTSPGSNRFPNGHGSSDEHGFPDSAPGSQGRFYDRSTSGGCATPAPVPEGGSGTCRVGRNRDRYRGGGAHRGGAAWGPGYESSRYNNSNERSQSETTGYNSVPTDTNERRNSDNVRKKAKSRSGSRSPSPNGSTSSRSLSRSRSRSSSSSSSSSTSRDTSSTSSPRSRRHRNHKKSSQCNSDDRRPLAICVRNLPVRSSDTSLKDGLFHEYKKHGKVTWVKIVGQNADRYAIVCFKKPEDAEKALEVSYDKLFFGCKIEVAPYSVCDIDEVEFRYESEIDEYNPKATRTLFIGNLEKDVTASDLRKHFDQFGEIIEIDIKKQGAVSSYAFCQYSDIVSVVKAIRKMDGEHLGNNRIKLGFGKSMAYNCVWVDGINENVNEKYLRIQFEVFGPISKCIVDRDKGQALIFYEQVSQAQLAVNKMRGFVLKNTKLQVDFASRECQECFFERLEKQGAVLDRAQFEERRDSTSRSFESTAPSRISRYDTPTRPRTSSYSSRSSVAAVASPGTPGSATPRGGGRARVARYYDYELDYAAMEGRHVNHRSYDEYSQGSGASHEDPYDPYDHPAYLHDSPGHLDPLEVRVVQNLVEAVPYPPHDIRNLQKERVHLLEQLEECPSSGDELISPKKRIKLDLLDPTNMGDVIIEANRDHNRKVMEVRRITESTLRHHSRRPSVDNKYGHYAPHAVGCKRRRTGGSDGGARGGAHSHYPEHSDGSDHGGSRPGTPLCDENPEFPAAGDPPKRTTRDREGPLMLPLPKWAAQVRGTPEFQRGSISVSGIKGQKEHVNPLASPPPAVTSPRVSHQHHVIDKNAVHARPPSPSHVVPPPASPPPRPPSLSSNSSDSDGAGQSPSLEERIRSLDEKYEKWSGSRALSQAGQDALALLDANREKFRLRHKLLEIQDLKEVQPSEIVKSVMAKRSVFDEDLKRLEGVGEKYEPKEFGLFTSRLSSLSSSGVSTPLSTTTSTTLVTASPLKLSTVTVQLPKTPTMLSPRSSGTSLPIPASRGLQYPFPSHPPVQMSPAPPPMPPSQAPASTTTSPVVAAPPSTSVTVRGPNLGENRLKPTANAPGDSRTSSLKSRSVVASVVSEVKPKTSEKVTPRRNSSCTSPRADVKTRRNSDTSARRIEEDRTKSEEQKLADKTKEELEKQQREQEEKERVEKERLEKERQEKERLERERKEKERLERESELEKQRLEKERLEKERREKAERERIEKEKEKERERLRQEKEKAARLERERAEKEKAERQEKERLEKERQEKERLEQERLQKELEERERKEREERELQERKEKEEREQKAKEEEQHRLAKEKEKERRKSEDRNASRHKQEPASVSSSSDNHHERSSKHRENHSEPKHRENNTHHHHHHNADKHEKSSKESSSNHDNHKRDTSGHHETSRHETPTTEKRKEGTRENNKHLNETKDHRDRAVVETRHMSLDLDKSQTLDGTKDRRKERNNSLPNMGIKRRMSSHEPMESLEEVKKIKLNNEHKKLSERRDSKDSAKSDEKSKKNKHKNNSHSSTTTTTPQEKHNSNSSKDDERRKEKEREREERHKKHKLEKQKSKSKSREKESKDTRESPVAQSSPTMMTDKDFLAKLNLRSNEEIEREKQEKQHKEKDLKEKRKDSTAELLEKLPDDKKSDEKLRKEKQQDKQNSFEAKDAPKPLQQDESKQKQEDRKPQLKKEQRIRKLTNTSDSDSDEPKKHSIFDIVDDGPPYISMYDKVKARSCKNMQKQEEEKRQEKIKAKFSQLKLSRARREEKKRSTSWDEDSDSDKDAEVKSRRCRKVLDSSDESQERKSLMRRKDMLYSDSDTSQPVRPSDDDVKTKHPLFRSSKSRITSDTSDDEYHKAKLEEYLDKKVLKENHLSENDLDADNKAEKITSVKNEIERLVKKERRNSKFQECYPAEHQHHTFNAIHSEPHIVEIKQENLNNKSIFDNTSDDDANEIKKDKSEKREKKHKKKQKKQKHLTMSCEELNNKPDSDVQEKKHHEKKKEHSKKDKKRDKTKDGRDKSKKSKKNKLDEKGEIRREGKLENIFGSLSEDSETGNKDQKPPLFLMDENARAPSSYNSESEKEPEVKSQEERDKEAEHKRKKEKKRRDKERRLQEAAAEAAAAAAEEPPNSNDNSMDFADMGKQLEANIKDDTSETEFKTEAESPSLETTDVPSLADQEVKKEKDERREGKEKKKKRKKSKDEKKHHHHHHHEKNKAKSPEIKQENVEPLAVPLISEPKQEPIEEVPAKPPTPQSLPSLDVQCPSTEKASPDFTLSPTSRDTAPMISPIPKTPVTTTNVIPGFGAEIDENVHENAVKSISGELEAAPVKTEEPVVKEEPKEPLPEPPEDKQRVVISQEETEDAVAALLGESFGSSQFEERYPEDIISTVGEEIPPDLADENVQDDEEMRKAVQSLEVEDDMVKPDTPQSEHELQIDTDTEEQEEAAQAIEQLTKTSEPRTPTPKTPDTQFFPSSSEKVVTPSPLAYKTLNSPPSLTPIKPQLPAVADVKRNLDKEQKSAPVLADQPVVHQRSVIAQTWPAERKEVIVPKTVTPPAIKITEPNYPPLAKLSPSVDAKVTMPVACTAPSTIPPQPMPKNQVVTQLHNLPARSPVQICKPALQEGMLSPKSSGNVPLNRLPITPVMVSKPLQATTVYLPQAKAAHSSEPPKLVAAADMRPQERPRMIFQTAPMPPYTAFAPGQPPRMIVQSGAIRHLPPTGLLVPTRHLSPATYGQFIGNVPHYQQVAAPSKEALNQNDTALKIAVSEQMKPTLLIASPNSPRTAVQNSSSHNPPHLVLTNPKTMQVNPALSPRSLNSPNSSQIYTTPTAKPISVIAESTLAHSPEPRSPPKASTPETTVKPQNQDVKVTKESSYSVPPIFESRTSTPSPVIVANPEAKIETAIPSSPVKLAIEKVTEELNLTLEKKSEPKKLEENTEMKIEKSEVEPIKREEEQPATDNESKDVKEEPVKEEPVKTTTSNEEKAKLVKEEDQLETKEDNDFWSAKDSVNIDSVIKTLGSADEMSDNENKEPSKSPKLEDNNKDVELANAKSEEISEEKMEDDTEGNEETMENEEEQKAGASVTRTSARRGRGGRPRGSTRTVNKAGVERGGIQTRRGKLKETQAQITSPTKRGRGGKMRNERKSSKSESDSTANDVYEFREDSDDSNKEQRPRLVLTIKSTISSTSNSQTTAIVKEITKDGAKEIGKETKEVPQPNKPKETPPAETKEDFSSPQTNTRKSRRLAEKDISRNTVDDTIEDVIKNTPQTRAAAANQRRSGRQVKKPQVAANDQETPRKSPRGRKPSRTASETTENSSSEETKDELPKNTEPPAAAPVDTKPPEPEKIKEPPPVQPVIPEKKVDHCSLKTAMLKRFKGEMSNLNKPEPTNLIDPVTGVLIPMRESEEGKYIPLPGTAPADKRANATPSTSSHTEPGVEVPKSQPSVIAQPHQPRKIHPLKALVLNSQAEQAAAANEPTPLVQAKPLSVRTSSPGMPQYYGPPASPSVVLSKPGTPVLQNSMVSSSTSVGPLSPRPGVPVAVTSKPQVKPPVLSPSQQILLANQKHLLHSREQHLGQQLQTIHIANSMTPQQAQQIVNSQLAHMKHRQEQQQAILGPKVSIAKATHSLHLAGQLPNSSIGKAQNAARLIQGPSQSGKGPLEPPKIDVNMPMMMGRPLLSPSGAQARLAGLPVAAYEASMGEPMAHFSPNPLRPPPDLNPAHYIHPQHMMYQQFLRQQQIHQHLQRAANRDKSGEEGEEPPLGLALSGRGAAVPHHSPHDRATESPAVGQVYNTLPHSARLPPYYPTTRYFDQQPSEPPPAHRPLTSHDRAGLPHISPLGGGERPLGAHAGLHCAPHLIPERPSSTTMPERPLSAHLVHDRSSVNTPERISYERPVVTAGLGAAGNLMGAVAKHIGVDVSTSQRVIQPTTPPLASQVPHLAQGIFHQLGALQGYRLVWQGQLALKNEEAFLQMVLISGNEEVAMRSMPKWPEGPAMRISQRMRLEPAQIDGVVRKMECESEHCILLALPCGHSSSDVVVQSEQLRKGFINYLQDKKAAGIVNLAANDCAQSNGEDLVSAFVAHILPSCPFADESLRRVAPNVAGQLNDMAHLLVIITTV